MDRYRPLLRPEYHRPVRCGTGGADRLSGDVAVRSAQGQTGKQIEQAVRELIYHTPIYADVMQGSCTRLYQTARQIIGNPRGVQEEEIQPELGGRGSRARTAYRVTSCCCCRRAASFCL